MVKRLLFCVSLCICLLLPIAAAEGLPLPAVLQDRTFVCDALETGVGDALYTLMFSKDSYRLYRDGGIGLLSAGGVTASVDKRLAFADEALTGTYAGSAFEAPSLDLRYDNLSLRFVPAGETAEYVYLSDLGVYESPDTDGPALLALERWFEFYLWQGGQLVRGTYEIHADGALALTADDGARLSGRRGETGFTLALSEGERTFAPAAGREIYKAAHAMGEYTLTVYDGDLFAIHGADGLVKALGTIEWTDAGGTARYFPRRVTGEVEGEDRYAVPFARTDAGLIFPETTPLLPRSGNIDRATGVGGYWLAGTTLEFLRQEEAALRETVTYEPRRAAWTTDDIPLETLANGEMELKQSMPSLGVAKPLALLIDFPDQHRPRFIRAADVEKALFGLDEPGSLASYYYRSSYGNLTIAGTVLDWVRMEHERAYYDSDEAIMREAISACIRERGLDLGDYDADGDGEVDALYVLWAGAPDPENGMWSSAYRSTWRNSPEEWGTAVRGYIFVPGSTVWSAVPPLRCNVNSLTHETGHLLGLNDYYSYDTSDRADAEIPYTGGALEGGLGGMDMMDVNMGDHNAFSKWLLGWLRPEIIRYEEIPALADAERVYTLHPGNEAPEALFIQLQPADSLFTELFVVEVVSPTMNASEFTRLKAPAVRVLHVDATPDAPGLYGNWRGFGFRNDNSYTSRKFIHPVEADGLDDVLNHLPESTKISYDPADLFAAGDALRPDGYPNSNAYDDYGNATVPTGLTIAVESISPEGEAVIRVGYHAPGDTLTLVSVEPEAAVVPWGAAGPATVPAGTNTFEFRFDRDVEPGAAELRVVSGNAAVDGWRASCAGDTLRLELDAPLTRGQACTVILPRGAIQSAADGTVVNEFNAIFGFLAE